MTDNHFIEIDDLESLDRFVANLNGSAGVVFKHSNTCGVSSRAYGEMSKLRSCSSCELLRFAESGSPSRKLAKALPYFVKLASLAFGVEVCAGLNKVERSNAGGAARRKIAGSR